VEKGSTMMTISLGIRLLQPSDGWWYFLAFATNPPHRMGNLI
jgi:hypothetical protein